MNVEHLSSADEATMRTLVRENSPLANLTAIILAALDKDTDYDSVLISIANEGTRLEISIGESPYRITLNEEDASCILYSQYDDDLEPQEEESEDLTEEGVETIVDIIASRPLSDENYGEE